MIYNTSMELTKRQKDILFAIIEEYAEVATPVGSVTLAKLFDVSSATIRAEMGRLEELGLITHPHTSAGRIPTDAGYRLYVNSLTEGSTYNGGAAGKLGGDASEGGAGGGDISGEKSESVEGGAARGGATGGGAAEAPRLGAGREMPREGGATLIDPTRLLPDPFLEKIDRLFNARVMTQTRADIAIRGAVHSLVELTGNLGLATIGDQLYLAGISSLFNQPEFLDATKVQQVAKLLDNLEPWLRETAPGEPLNIFIGAENPIGKAAEMSLIISKFRSPYSDSSYIGVLGPTRQNYGRVMALVRRAGEMLEEGL